MQGRADPGVGNIRAHPALPLQYVHLPASAICYTKEPYSFQKPIYIGPIQFSVNIPLWNRVVFASGSLRHHTLPIACTDPR